MASEPTTQYFYVKAGGRRPQIAIRYCPRHALSSYSHRTYLGVSAGAPLAAVGDHGRGALVMSQNKQSTTQFDARVSNSKTVRQTAAKRSRRPRDRARSVPSSTRRRRTRRRCCSPRPPPPRCFSQFPYCVPQLCTPQLFWPWRFRGR